jgi:choline dehydrogenase-like flavoprotein
VQLDDGTRLQAGEVILSAGVYGSAAVLLRSRIGPGADLRDIGIPVLVDHGNACSLFPRLAPHRELTGKR